MRKFINRATLIFCMICVSSAYAEGYVKHILNNTSNHDCFVMLHQKFYFPIDTCLTSVDNHNTKTCDGPLYLDEPAHVYNVICNKKEGSTVWSTELNGTYNISYSSSQSVEITWDIRPTPDNKSVRITATSRRL